MIWNVSIIKIPRIDAGQSKLKIWMKTAPYYSHRIGEAVKAERKKAPLGTALSHRTAAFGEAKRFALGRDLKVSA